MCSDTERGEEEKYYNCCLKCCQVCKKEKQRSQKYICERVKPATEE